VVYLLAFLTSAVDGGGEWLASRPGHFTPGKRIPDTNWIGGWVGSRTDLDAVMKRKKSMALPGIEPLSFSL